MESTRPCPNCGSQVGVGTTVCPNCGAVLPPPSAQPAWPPPPGGFPPPQTFALKLVTGSTAGDVILGIVLSFVTCFIGGLGLIASPILYFVLRPTHPMFARGLGYGFLTALVLLLGAFALCFYGISHEKV